MAMAATQKLPLVCLVESSLDSPLQLPNQVASGPYIGADPTFYPRIPVDGCDVVGVFRVAQEAIRRAREGHGPAVIECLTARSNAKNDGKQSPQSTWRKIRFHLWSNICGAEILWSDEWSRSIIEGFDQELNKLPLLSKIPPPLRVSLTTSIHPMCGHRARQQLQHAEH